MYSFTRISLPICREAQCIRSVFRSFRFPSFHNSSAGIRDVSPDDIEPGFGPVEEVGMLPTKKEFRQFPAVVKKEFKVWTEEMKENFKNDPNYLYNPGEIHKVFTFSTEGDIEKWALKSDEMEGFGYSKCTFSRSSNGHALFSGTLSTAVRQDGKSYRSGFCAVRSPRARKSFGRKSFYDWTQYTHLVMKVRGDGRVYLITLGADGHFSVTWHNTYSYFLFTRGGPYWQTAKIPFSKFIFGHKGHIQDRQPALQQDTITCLHVGICDDIDAPFQLEIDYIGLEIIGHHNEENAYESYLHDQKHLWRGDS